MKSLEQRLFVSHIHPVSLGQGTIGRETNPSISMSLCVDSETSSLGVTYRSRRRFFLILSGCAAVLHFAVMGLSAVGLVQLF